VDQITINVETGAESGTLVASWDDPRGGGLTTQAENLTELEKNIREAIEAHFDSDEIPSRIRIFLAV
jgi:predicted RNase H-like HicB family nuclease